MMIEEVIDGEIFLGEKGKLAYWTGTESSGVRVLVKVFSSINRATFHPFLLNYVLWY